MARREDVLKMRLNRGEAVCRCERNVKAGTRRDSLVSRVLLFAPMICGRWNAATVRSDVAVYVRYCRIVRRLITREMTGLLSVSKAPFSLRTCGWLWYGDGSKLV
jgi:hypothetical protein